MKSIMVVDDDPDVLYTVQKVLEKSGYRVIGANGGKECLENLKDNTPDLILLDIMMPDLDGWDVLKEIRSQKNMDLLPVAMLTAKSFSSNTVKKKDIKGLLEHVVKPFTRERMSDKQMIDRGSSFFWIDKPFTTEGLIRKVETIFECVEER